MSEKVTQSKVPYQKIDPISPETYRLFKQLYPLYKGVRPTADEKTQSNQANWYLYSSREAAKGRLDYAPNLSAAVRAPPSTAKKREMRSGEKRIGGEVKNDVRQLSKAGADLKLRLGKSVFGVTDTSLNNDIARYFASSRITVAKAEALVALYSPYMMQDPDIALLGAKAMADLAYALALEGDARALMQTAEFESPLLGKTRASDVREQSRNLYKEAEILAEWAHRKGQPKAGILLSKLIRINAASLTPEQKAAVYKKAQDALQEACFKKDQEALIENAKLHTAMWLNGDAEEKDALTILEPLGKKGADALREHFEAGSADAGARLANIILTKSKPETFKERFERFYQAVVDLFSSGNTVLAGEEPFLSKDPHRLSSAETDFLIKEALINSRSPERVSAAILQKHLGPKVPLNQARGLLNLTGEKIDPYMVVNRQEAYRHILSAGTSLLSPAASDKAKESFVNETLAPYLKKIDQESYAFEVLSGLLVDLGGSRMTIQGASFVTPPTKKENVVSQSDSSLRRASVSESDTEEKGRFESLPGSPSGSRRSSIDGKSDSSKDEFFDVEREEEDFVPLPGPRSISRRSSVASESDDDGGYDYDLVEVEPLKGSFSSSVASKIDTPSGAENWTDELEQLFKEVMAPVQNWKANLSTPPSPESSPESSTSEMDFDFAPLQGEKRYEWLDEILNEESAVIKPTGQPKSDEQVEVVMEVAGDKFKVQATKADIVQLGKIAKLLSTPTPESFLLAVYLAAPMIKKQYPHLSEREMAQFLRSEFISRVPRRKEPLPPARITELPETKKEVIPIATETPEGEVILPLPTSTSTTPASKPSKEIFNFKNQEKFVKASDSAFSKAIESGFASLRALFVGGLLGEGTEVFAERIMIDGVAGIIEGFEEK